VASRIPCGILGIDHAHANGKLDVLRKSDEFELVAVCEPDDAIRERRARERRFEDVRWVSQEELLGDDAVAMVAVECDTPRLLELGRAAIDAGKHIHLDKPPGTSLSEFRALLDEAERRGLIVQMGYMFRYNTGFDFVRRAVSKGWLGELHYIHASICTNLGSAKRRGLSDHPGGMMLELGCHLMDMIVLLLGAPTKVAPFLRHDAEADDALNDNTVAVLEFGDAMAVVESAAMEAEPFPHRRFKVCGSRGTAILEPLEPPGIQLCLLQDQADFKRGWQTIEVDHVPRYVRDFQELARCLRGEMDFPYPKSHDFDVQRAVLRACGVDA